MTNWLISLQGHPQHTWRTVFPPNQRKHSLAIKTWWHLLAHKNLQEADAMNKRDSEQLSLTTTKCLIWKASIIVPIRQGCPVCENLSGWSFLNPGREKHGSVINTSCEYANICPKNEITTPQ